MHRRPAVMMLWSFDLGVDNNDDTDADVDDGPKSKNTRKSHTSKIKSTKKQGSLMALLLKLTLQSEWHSFFLGQSEVSQISTEIRELLPLLEFVQMNSRSILQHTSCWRCCGLCRDSLEPQASPAWDAGASLLTDQYASKAQENRFPARLFAPQTHTEQEHCMLQYWSSRLWGSSIQMV